MGAVALTSEPPGKPDRFYKIFHGYAHYSVLSDLLFFFFPLSTSWKIPASVGLSVSSSISLIQLQCNRIKALCRLCIGARKVTSRLDFNWKIVLKWAKMVNIK